MTNLQKDQAIYNEMLQIANEVFNNATENNESLREYMNENSGVVSINDITKVHSEVYSMIVYKRGVDEQMETMVAVLGDMKVKSQQIGRYPNWKAVLPDFSTMRHFAIADEHVQTAQKWLSKVKAYSVDDGVAVSVYKGSDTIYFDIDNATTTFRLSRPSDITLGTRLSIKRMQSKKFSGFWFPKFGGATIVDDANCDLMLVMPLVEGERTPNKEDREVVCETALIAEMQVA